LRVIITSGDAFASAGFCIDVVGAGERPISLIAASWKIESAG
jgi:hypothetical protein